MIAISCVARMPGSNYRLHLRLMRSLQEMLMILQQSLHHWWTYHYYIKPCVCFPFLILVVSR